MGCGSSSVKVIPAERRDAAPKLSEEDARSQQEDARRREAASKIQRFRRGQPISPGDRQRREASRRVRYLQAVVSVNVELRLRALPWAALSEAAVRSWIAEHPEAKKNATQPLRAAAAGDLQPLPVGELKLLPLELEESSSIGSLDVERLLDPAEGRLRIHEHMRSTALRYCPDLVAPLQPSADLAFLDRCRAEDSPISSPCKSELPSDSVKPPQLASGELPLERSSPEPGDEVAGDASAGTLAEAPPVIQPRRPSVTSLSSQGRVKVATGKPFPKRPMMSRLSKLAWDKLELFFRKMDVDCSNAVTKENAAEFFKGSFAKLSTDAMFNEVDIDGSGAITADEFIQFWTQVRNAGYSDQDIIDEVEMLMEGSAWVDWKDGRDTGSSSVKFPKRPLFCKLSSKCWAKCEALFRSFDKDGTLTITRQDATEFYKGSFIQVSVEAMFNEIDLLNHGAITAEEFMKFWVQVKSSGYKEKDIMDEIEMLMEGGSWVDWKDGRSTA